MSAARLRENLRSMADERIAEHSRRYFKTGKGEYGEGDRFLGIRVPEVRKRVLRHRDEGLPAIVSLLKSPWHEERLFAVLSLADRFERGDAVLRRRVYGLYTGNLDRVNNWDLVDLSAHRIVGPWLEDRSRKPIYRMARSEHLWTRRVAILSTLHYIRQDDFGDTLAIARLLLADEHDLIHKATGWMLREVGNRDRKAEEAFLLDHYRDMPRTMLRYAIEKFPEDRRQAFLHGRV